MLTIKKMAINFDRVKKIISAGDYLPLEIANKFVTYYNKKIRSLIRLFWILHVLLGGVLRYFNFNLKVNVLKAITGYPEMSIYFRTIWEKRHAKSWTISPCRNGLKYITFITNKFKTKFNIWRKIKLPTKFHWKAL